MVRQFPKKKKKRPDTLASEALNRRTVKMNRWDIKRTDILTFKVP